LELDRCQLLVVEKGEKSRYVYLTAITIDKLRAYLKERREFWGKHCSDALFIGRSGGGLTTTGVYQVLKAAADRVHLNGRWNPHSWRHAFARDMLRNGADLSQVSQLMGHAGIQVTADYYARWADSELRQAHKQNSPAHQMPGGEK
jgi:site-specific recombinase XerD